MRHIVVLGNGIAGTTAAREIRKRCDDRITIVSSESRHLYSRPALMYIYMGHMKPEHTKPYEDWFWEKNRLELIHDHVEAIDFERKHLTLRDGGSLEYDVLILATGSQSRLPEIPGIGLRGVQGLYGLPDLQRMEENTRDIREAVVVGGGLIGVEMSEMLRSRGIHVHFLVREKTYWSGVLPPEEGRLIERHIREHHVDLHLGTEAGEILGDETGRVTGVRTRSGGIVPGQFAGIAVGVLPHIGFLRGTALETDRGILVDAHFRTSIPDVYAAGDCAQLRSPPPGRRPVEQVWYTGRIQAEFLAHTLCGDPKPYAPGVWFNSAKFFDIEYQTYGDVPPACPGDERDLYWEDPKGKRCVRIRYRAADGAVRGFNFLGIRARHQVCEQWIAEQRNIQFVIDNLRALNFDPEFFKPFAKAVQEAARQTIKETIHAA